MNEERSHSGTRTLRSIFNALQTCWERFIALHDLISESTPNGRPEGRTLILRRRQMEQPLLRPGTLTITQSRQGVGSRQKVTSNLIDLPAGGGVVAAKVSNGRLEVDS